MLHLCGTDSHIRVRRLCGNCARRSIYPPGAAAKRHLERRQRVDHLHHCKTSATKPLLLFATTRQKRRRWWCRSAVFIHRPAFVCISGWSFFLVVGFRATAAIFATRGPIVRATFLVSGTHSPARVVRFGNLSYRSCFSQFRARRLVVVS
jgi:hypothetical protein